jgi:hypothetical protein
MIRSSAKNGKRFKGIHPRYTKFILAVLVLGFSVKSSAFFTDKGQTALGAKQKVVLAVGTGSKSVRLGQPTVSMYSCETDPAKVSDLVCKTSQRTAAKVPEPASLFLVGVGLISIGALVRRRTRRQLP